MTTKRPLYAFAGSLPATSRAKKDASLTMQGLLSRVSRDTERKRLSASQWEALNSRLPADLEEIAEFDCGDE